MARQSLTENVARLAEPLALELGLELVEVEFLKERGEHILRVLIDREGGVRLDDCESLSRTLGEVLDQEDPVPHSYLLEVSSAGIERPLKKEADYKRFAGKRARIKLYSPFMGQKVYSGVLLGIENGEVRLETGKGGIIGIPPEKIAKANLLF